MPPTGMALRHHEYLWRALRLLDQKSKGLIFMKHLHAALMVPIAQQHLPLSSRTSWDPRPCWAAPCHASPLVLLLFPLSHFPLSLSSSSPQLRSSFLGSVQLADTFATDGWCTRRQLSLLICGPLCDSRTDAF